MARRRELGLCYKCGERYSPTHTCRDKHLQVFLLDVGPENKDPEAEATGEGVENFFDAEGELTRMELSLNSIVGFEGNHTMKIKGSLAGETMVILIDSGATHNFIAEEFMRKPGVKVDEVAEYTISVGDGYTVRQKLRCRDVSLQVQGLKVVQTFYPFPLRGVDVVLGIEWLKTLGDVKVNWRQMTMQIGKRSNRVCLKGDPTLTRTQASLQAIFRTMKKKGEGFLLECSNIERGNMEETKPPPGVQKILEKYPMVCNAMGNLPPFRTQDHAILIKPGEQPQTFDRIGIPTLRRRR